MRLDAVTAEIRPRSNWEAVDLGLAMVRRDFWRCITVWWLAMLVPLAVVGALLWEYPMVVLMLFWWWKPAGSRMVLFEQSRRLFGERPRWKDVLRQIPGVWGRRFFYRFVWARFSPWLPVTLAVEELEGLRGADYKRRCGQVTRRGEGVVMWIYFVGDLAACWFGLAILLVVMMFIPAGQDGAWKVAWESWDPQEPGDIPLLISRSIVACVMLAMSLTDLFVVGAGFGVYLNNRTWIEGWDVELAFKRLAKRLTGAAMLWLAMSVVFLSIEGRGEEVNAEAEAGPAQVINEVKADPDFKVHTVTERVPKENSSTVKWPSWLRFGSAAEWIGTVFTISAIGVLVGLIAWFIWKNRHAFVFRGIGGKSPELSSRARVVMGMEVSPETLPDNVPAAAWQHWQNGRYQEALGLLYRGAISQVIEIGRVEILESDTEGDCVRRVEAAGVTAHPDYFRRITGVWVGLAYGGRRPEDQDVEALCRQWPFVERKDA